ncbi:ADPribosylglycohydrolase superfamily protein, variant 2 [Balamuthia mandrillaris]
MSISSASTETACQDKATAAFGLLYIFSFSLPVLLSSFFLSSFFLHSSFPVLSFLLFCFLVPSHFFSVSFCFSFLSSRNFFTGGCTIEELRQQNREKEYPGNAPPMRAIPLAFIQDDPQRQFHYALLNADATHPHPKARVASYLIVKAAEYMIIKREEPRGIIDYCLASCGVEKIDEETYDYLREVNQLEDYHVLEERSRNRERRRRERMEKRKDRDEEDYEEDEEEECGIDYELLCGPQPIPTYNINGVGPDSMRTAGCVLYILKFYRSPMDTLRIAIQMGGDVDSLASICLGIVGGRYGLTGLPSWMFDQLEAKDELIALAKRFEEFVAEAESCVLP